MSKCTTSYMLEELQKPYDKYTGICDSYIWYMCQTPASLARELMIECCKELGIYSGNPRYPISHPWFTPKFAFDLPFSKWSIFTVYGRRRRRVRKLMIKKLKEILDD